MFETHKILKNIPNENKSTQVLVDKITEIQIKTVNE